MTKVMVNRELLELVLGVLERSSYMMCEGALIRVNNLSAISALRTALEQPVQEPVATQWLAKMIMSDCGCSTNNQRLFDRIVARIEQYDRSNAAPQAQEKP